MTVGRHASVLLLGGVMLAACSRHDSTPQSLTTTVAYDSSSKALAITCERSSSGSCHLLIQSGGRQQQVSVPAGTSKTVPQIAPSARTCAGIAPPNPRACAWAPVTG